MDKYLQAVSDAAHSVEGLSDDAFAVWKALERMEEDAEVNTAGLEEAISKLQGLQSNVRYILCNVQDALDQAVHAEAETEKVDEEARDSEED